MVNRSNTKSYSCSKNSHCNENWNPKKLYHKLKKLEKKISCNTKTTYLTNADFREGSYIIDRPGKYVLKENIVFNPNPENDHMPYDYQSKYQTRAFSLGFFAAVIIQTKNVILDLNGFRIDQSKEHALQQRFFALVELANSPFIPPQGPGDFGKIFKPARRTIIRNGTLGRSSHHGIHGNNAKWLLFEDLKLEDFEVAGIAINGSDSVVFNHVKIQNSRKDIPVIATYSASRFARMFGKSLLKDYGDLLNENQKQRLVSAIHQLEVILNQAYNEIMETGETSVELYRNETQLPDGNIYGLLLHTPGVAVDDFIVENHEKEMDWTQNIFLRKVSVKNIRCKVNEIIGLSGPNGVGVQADVAGAVFQIEKVTDKNGRYHGNPLSDLKLLLAEISHQLNISLGKNSITADTVEWAKSNQSIDTLLAKGYKYKCNGDSMFHVNKGAIGYRFDGVENMLMKKCILDNLVNYGRLGNETLDGKYVLSHDQQKRSGYGGCDSLGINLSYCKQVVLNNNSIRDVLSANGDAVGLNTINKSKCLDISRIWIKGLYAGTVEDEIWVGENYYGDNVPYEAGLPNTVSNAIGIHISEDSKNVSLGKRYICDLDAAGCEVPVWSN